MGDWFMWLVALAIILTGAELFVNAIEWVGKIFNLSEGATGSVLAAVGTALPEAIIPIVAILFSASGSGHDIGIGAILGAPLMLSTLAMFVTGFAVMIFSYRRQSKTKVFASYVTMGRDLLFFIILYTLAVLAGLITLSWLKVATAVFLILAYCFYVYDTMRQEVDHKGRTVPNCYFARKNPFPPVKVVLLQVLCALGLILIGAHFFVESITVVAENFGIPAFILAIIITPVATELPEKFNSIIWVSRGKDTLALGNITGAMVFQGSLIPAVGILLTDWQLTASALLSGILALLSAGILFFELRRKKHISAWSLIFCGVFYVIFLVFVFRGWIH